MMFRRCILFICLVVIALGSSAQGRKYTDYSYPQDYSYSVYGGTYGDKLLNHYHSENALLTYAYRQLYSKKYKMPDNYYTDCAQAYFNYWSKKGFDLFSTVTAKFYEAKDSTTRDKKLYKKVTVTFNKKGLKELVVEIDSMGRISDSVRYTYDKDYDMQSETDYTLGGSPEMMQKSFEEHLVYDNKKRVVRDSTWTRTDLQYKRAIPGPEEVSVQRKYYTYDDSGAVIKYVAFSDADTIMYNRIVDYKNKTETDNTYQYGKHATTFFKMDSAGKMLEYKMITEKDTIESKSSYDKKERPLVIETYNDNRITEMLSYAYKADGSWVETQENFSDNTGPSCPNDSKKVSTYNKDSLEVSEVLTNEREGKTIVTNTLHWYRMTGKKVAQDSEVTTESGEMYASTSIRLHNYKYDKKGMIIDETQRGGGEYAQNTHYIRAYNKKENLLKEDYYSCVGAPTSRTVNIYYPDDETVKEYKLDQNDQQIIKDFDKTGRYAQETLISKYMVKQVTYEYTK